MRLRPLHLSTSERRVLDCPYFHVGFTVPEEIAAIGYPNKEVVYAILFRTAAETLKSIAADPKHLGAEISFFAVLHSWGQTLVHHPHLHCVVPGGGLSPDGQRWIPCRRRFFLPVRAFSRLFRRRFLECLPTAFDSGKVQFFGALEPLRDSHAFARHLARTKSRPWVVYARSPDRNRCSTRWAAILTAWPLATTACSISKTVKSASNGKTTGITIRSKR